MVASHFTFGNVTRLRSELCRDINLALPLHSTLLYFWPRDILISKRQRTYTMSQNNKRPLSPPPSSSPPSSLPKFLNHGPSVLKSKFRAINAHESTLRSNPEAIFRHPIAHARNRYPDINPWAHNRIHLDSLPFPYINASPIDLGRDKERFIATQGPVDVEGGTGARDFWEMVWQEDVEVVVMLTQAVEEGREKCGVYYPEEKGAVREFDGWGRIECVGLSEEWRTEVREIKVSRRKGWSGAEEDEEWVEEERTVWHFLFLGWPDQEVPKETTDFLELIKMTRFRIDGPTMKGEPNVDGEQNPRCKPRVVHCSAGVGRTGTFIALDHLLQEFDDGELDKLVGETGVDETGEEIDPIFETVKQLREQRMFMVYQPSQYAFIYQVLKEKWVARKKGLETPKVKADLFEENGSPTKKRKGFEDGFGGALNSGTKFERAPDFE